MFVSLFGCCTVRLVCGQQLLGAGAAAAGSHSCRVRRLVQRLSRRAQSASSSSHSHRRTLALRSCSRQLEECFRRPGRQQLSQQRYMHACDLVQQVYVSVGRCAKCFHHGRFHVSHSSSVDSCGGQAKIQH